jgi:hypoxanthine-DNA glycosylase
MNTISGFLPIESSDARILILGSMPSKASLDSDQYYAHPRNSFWYIIESLFAKESGLPYQHRKELLIKNRIALWDVMQSCQRPGSLDSSIEQNSIVINRFDKFYEHHPMIKMIFFNGSKAEMEYKKRVLPELEEDYADLASHRLPSTSPAMATLRQQQKLTQWKILTRYL